jgi:hypothetical protein
MDGLDGNWGKVYESSRLTSLPWFSNVLFLDHGNLINMIFFMGEVVLWD